MDDIQRFDEFEWLLANKVVNENVLPDENVLVYSGHSAFSIGLTELYFVNYSTINTCVCLALLLYRIR